MSATGETSKGKGQKAGTSFRNHRFVRFICGRKRILSLQDQDIAQQSGISKATVSIIVNGLQDPRTITNVVMEGLARTLGVPMGYLLILAGYDLGNNLAEFTGGAAAHEYQEAGRLIYALHEVATVDLPPINNLAELAALPEEQFKMVLSQMQKVDATRRHA